MNKVSWPFLIMLLLTVLECNGRDLNRFESGQLQKATQRLEANEVEAALALMQPLLEQPHPHPVVFQYACRSLTDTGAETAAQHCWERGYKLYVDNISIAISLANIQLQTAQYQAAINTLTALELTDDNALLLSQKRYMQGYAHYQLMQYQAA